LFDGCGFGSKKATKKFLKWADEYNPDLVWLHNIHGYYINIEYLFDWIKSRPDMQVKWTLHDCWAFTGHCTYFTCAGCSKWQTKCEKCPQKQMFPSSYFLDRSEQNFLRKKSLFSGIANIQLYTPSKWLADLTRKSFLKDYPVEVLYNSIDNSVFKPTISDFKERYNVLEKIIVLGVASVWEKRKGFDDFLALNSMLDDRFVIVLVGLSSKQIKKLPEGIIGIENIKSADELAKIYSAADVFVNPSKEETFGMTTLEAVSCGTKAIVYKNTACEEVVNKFGGIAVEQDVECLYKTILKEVS
jgi:glycosyltransferase involved in cell wall biosynthesis